LATDTQRPDPDPTVQQLAAMYDEHQRAAGPILRFANRTTRTLGRPASLVVIVALILAWMVGNYLARLLGSHALEEFPFPDLGFAATVTGLLVAMLILTTQRHEEELAEKRARLTLQIAVLSEKKIAKVIQLLEEQRRDNPLLASRYDPEAEAMGTASDPRATLEQLEEARSEP
jgi:uncharacterized membrane protein